MKGNQELTLAELIKTLHDDHNMSFDELAQSTGLYLKDIKMAYKKGTKLPRRVNDPAVKKLQNILKTK